jgi:hypothetical protein
MTKKVVLLLTIVITVTAVFLCYGWSCTTIYVRGADWQRNIFGYAQWEQCMPVVMADDNGVYVAGHFDGGVDLDPGPAVNWIRSAPDGQGFVLRLDGRGRYEWSRSWGNAYIASLAADGAGDIWVAGSIRVNPHAGQRRETSEPHGALQDSGRSEIFIACLDATGSGIWHKSIGGAECDAVALDITTDSEGNAYIAGRFDGRLIINTCRGTVALVSSGRSDGLVLKATKAGTFDWAMSMGGLGSDQCTGTCLVDSHAIYVLGDYEGHVDFDPSSAVENISGDADFRRIYLAKLDPSGAFHWVRSWGNDDAVAVVPSAMSIDDGGGIYVLGGFRGILDFDPGPGTDQRQANGIQDVFLFKVDGQGDMIWTKTMGDDMYDDAFSLSVSSGSIYVAGYMRDDGHLNARDWVDYEPVEQKGAKRGFLTAYNTAGDRQWGRLLGVLPAAISSSQGGGVYMVVVLDTMFILKFSV